MRVFVLDVGLVCYKIDVLVKCFKKYRKHLLTVMLLEPCKLCRLLCNYSFDIPWLNMLLFSHVQLSNKVGKGYCQFPFSPKLTCLVQMKLVYFKQKVLNEWQSVRYTLQYTIHEASIAQVHETYETTFGVMIQDRDYIVIHTFSYFGFYLSFVTDLSVDLLEDSVYLLAQVFFVAHWFEGECTAVLLAYYWCLYLKKKNIVFL